MKLEYNLRLIDEINWAWFVLKNTPYVRKRIVIFRSIACVFGAVFTIAGLFFFISGLGSAVVIIALGIFLICYGIISYSDKYMKRKLGKRVSKIYKQSIFDIIAVKTLIISSDGINSTSDLGESHIKWEAIEEIVKTGDYLYLVMDNGISALTIPSKTFKSKNSLDKFLSEVEQYTHKETRYVSFQY